VDLSIIIPSFNEYGNIQEIVNRIQHALKASEIHYEIWFIDDSQDETPILLETLSQQLPCVHYMHREKMRGLGTAVVEGFEHSQGDYLIVMDADLQHPPELLPAIWQELQSGTDIVIPSRFITGGSDGGLSFFRQTVSWVARKLGQIAIKQFRTISDCTSGYFGLKHSVIDKVAWQASSWKILMEILVKGNYSTVREIPYHFVARDVGQSKMNLREQWNYLRHIVTLKMYDRHTRERPFSAASLFKIMRLGKRRV